MQIKHLFFLVYSFIGAGIFADTQAQTTIPPTSAIVYTGVKALKIGDQVPDIVFENVLNYKSKKEKLSAFKGKLVILDIWSTWCSTCIEGFPKMERLQKTFKDKVQILLVNPFDARIDSEERIKQTLKKNQQRTGFYPSLPVPIHDSILNHYFPYISVPQHVWINGEGKVIAITHGMSAAEENVRSYLEGKTLNLPVKNDWAYDQNKPLLIDGNGGDPNDFMVRSVFTGYKGGIGFGGGERVNANYEVIGKYMLNKPLRYFINSAYREIMNGLRVNRIFLNVKNAAQFSWKFDTAFAYCYDLTIPPVKAKFLHTSKILQEDLLRYFNVRVYKEKRTLPCLVITAPNKIDHSATKYNEPAFDIDENSIRKFVHNYSVGEAIKLLDNCEKPLINETGLSTHIDLDFPDNFSLTDMNTLIDVLKKAGFSIREEERELEVIVITDK